MPRINAKPNAKPNAKVPEPPPPPVNNPHTPSVPISLYREVSTELQSTKTKLESFRLQNQELSQQNQQLRVEIERVVQSALQLRQIADAHQAGSLAPAETPSPGVEVYFEAASAPLPPPPPHPGTLETPEASTRQPLFTEQPPLPRRKPDSPRPSDIGGWWLVLAVVVIVVTAFGTGFLIVRPLLPSR